MNPNFNLSPIIEANLRELITQMLDYNTRVNLTSIRESEAAWNKHVLDSLQGLTTRIFDGDLHVIDVGTGPGFPGLPLAIARPRELRLTFVESVNKKCEFIRQMNQKFDLRARILNERAEVLGQDYRFRAKFDVATARAVGSLTEVAELTMPFVAPHGYAVLWRGKDAVEEAREFKWPLSRLGGVVQDVIPYQLPDSEMTYHLTIIQKKSPTPKTFPRAVGVPKRDPLLK